MVSMVGFEPTRIFMHKHLKLACLPIPTHGHKGGSRVLSAPKESEVVNLVWTENYEKLRTGNFTTCQFTERGRYHDKIPTGLGSRNRTHDILNPRQVLYQTELYPVVNISARE